MWWAGRRRRLIFMTPRKRDGDTCWFILQKNIRFLLKHVMATLNSGLRAGDQRVTSLTPFRVLSTSGQVVLQQFQCLSK